LILVAFIMDRDPPLKILQSAVLEYSPGTGFVNRPAAEKKLAIYPNPAHDYVYINFGAEVELAGELSVNDLAGRSVLTSEVLPGYSIQKLDISSLSPGVYMVQWMDSGVLRGHGKLLHTH
jgi:Secretion system C-terminal sorting domain